jgi:hypothetical protein
MTVQYLLTCECGAKTPVSTAQAGTEVPCECGRTLPVPTLLALKQLETAEVNGPAASKRSWTPLQGGMFAGGVAVVILAVGMAVLVSVKRSKLDTAKPRVPDLAALLEDTHARTPDVQWQMWWILSDPQNWPLDRPVPAYIKNRRTDRNLKIGLAIAIGFGLLGFAASVGSFFVKRKPRGKRRRRKRLG